MSKSSDYPTVIMKKSRKGIMAWLNGNCRAVVNIVRLKKDIPHGTQYKFDDIEGLEDTLWICDLESLDLMIAVLNKLRKKMVAKQKRENKNEI